MLGIPIKRDLPNDLGVDLDGNLVAVAVVGCAAHFAVSGSFRDVQPKMTVAKL